MDAIYWVLYFGSPFVWFEEPRHLQFSKHSPLNLSTLWSWLSLQTGLRRHAHLRCSDYNLLFSIIRSTTSILASSLISHCKGRSITGFLIEASNSDRGWKCFLKAYNVYRKTKLHPNYQLNKWSHWDMPSKIAAHHTTFISSASWSRVRCSFSLSLKLTSCIFSV